MIEKIPGPHILFHLVTFLLSSFLFNFQCRFYLFCLFMLQRHDIFKKRIDSSGKELEVKKDVIGAPKVSNNIILLACL